MYEHLDIDQFVETAKTYVLVNDRSIYEEYCKIIEDYCKECKIYIAGGVGLGLSLGEPRNCDQWIYEVWSITPFDHAKELANKLASVKTPHLDTETLVMNTRIKYCEFEIYVQNRIICQIKRIWAKDQTFVDKLYGTGTVDGYHIRDLRIIPNILLFENILHKLYLTDHCDEWPTLVEYAKLFVKRKIFKSGGRDTGDIKNKMVEWLKKYVRDKGMPLLGLPVGPFTFLCSDVELFAGDFKLKWGKSCTCEIRENATYLVNDDRLIKYSVHVRCRGESFILCNYYANTAYEIVPVREADGDLYVTEWCKLRFLIVEIWVMHIIETLTGKKVQLKDDLLSCVHQLFTEALMAGTAPWPDEWVGYVVPERVAKNKIIKAQGFIKQYIPALALMPSD